MTRDEKRTIERIADQVAGMLQVGGTTVEYPLTAVEVAALRAALRAPAVTGEAGIRTAREFNDALDAALYTDTQVGHCLPAHEVEALCEALKRRLAAPPAVTGEADSVTVTRAQLASIEAVDAPGDYKVCPACNLWEEKGHRDGCWLAAALSAPPAAVAPPAEGSPLPLEHTRSCGTLTGRDCTCGLAWRIRLATEQEMHAAWRKRANEAEARENAGAPPALVALEQHARMMRDMGGTWHRAIPWEFVERAAWSPAPAPVAPPAEHPDDYWIGQRQDAYLPAPPAVAGGDAPEIRVGDVVIEDDEWQRARHIQTEDQALFWSSPTKLGPNALVIMGERDGQPFIWRRRQEGQ